VQLIRGEYKLWIYGNYIVSLLRFHLCVDAVSNQKITQSQLLLIHYLKNLPRSAIQVILYYQGVCCPSITHVSHEVYCLVSVATSSDYRLQELGLHLQLGKALLQTQDSDYSWLTSVCEQLSSMLTARLLYLKAKRSLSDKIPSECEAHLQTLSGLLTLLSWRDHAHHQTL